MRRDAGRRTSSRDPALGLAIVLVLASPLAMILYVWDGRAVGRPCGRLTAGVMPPGWTPAGAGRPALHPPIIGCAGTLGEGKIRGRAPLDQPCWSPKDEAGLDAPGSPARGFGLRRPDQPDLNGRDAAGSTKNTPRQGALKGLSDMNNTAPVLKPIPFVASTGRSRDQQLSELIGVIYDTVIDPSLWQDAIRTGGTHFVGGSGSRRCFARTSAPIMLRASITSGLRRRCRPISIKRSPHRPRGTSLATWNSRSQPPI